MSGAFYDLGEAHRQLAHSCLSLMRHDLKFNICDLESSHFPNSKIIDLPSRIKEHISPALFYASRFWDDHLECVSFDQVWLTQLRPLFEQKFLFWLEVLSVTTTVDLATAALLSLKAWLGSGHHNEVCPIFECSNREVNGYDCNRLLAVNWRHSRSCSPMPSRFCGISGWSLQKVHRISTSPLCPSHRFLPLFTSITIRYFPVRCQ